MQMIDEIRINEAFAKHIRSIPDKPYDTKEDSTPIIRKSLMDTEDFLSKFRNHVNGSTQVLPANCRYFQQLTPERVVVIIEEPPAYRTISASFLLDEEIDLLKRQGKIEEWNIDTEYYSNVKNAPFRFTLAFPYVIFILVIENRQSFRVLSGEVFLRNSRMTSINDYLLKIPLMNISSDQKICFGDNIRVTHENTQKSVENAIMTFWSASFNTDYKYNYTAYKDTPGVNTHIGWHALSKIDPMFIYQVKWIPYNNIRSILDETYLRYRREGFNMTFTGLAKIFTQPAECEDNREDKSKLYSDVLNGIYINDETLVHVGDIFMLGKKKVMVNSFMGNIAGRVTHLRCDLENGKRIIIKLSPRLLNVIERSIHLQRYETSVTLPNGEVLKEGNIVEVKINDESLFYRVKIMRKAKDGTTELQMGNSFFILEYLKDIKIVDVSKLSLPGISINQDDIYLNNRSSDIFKCFGYWVKFKIHDVDPSSGRMKFIFEEVGGDNRLSLSIGDELISGNGREKLKNIKELTPLPTTFYHGREIFSQIGGGGALDTIYKDKHSIYGRSSCVTNRVSLTTIYEDVVSNDGTVFHMEGIYNNVTFHVGDKVVVADWADPIEVLKIKEIQAFVKDQDNDQIKFILTDKHNKITQVPYIFMDYSGRSGRECMVVDIGKIRKITPMLNGITPGTKIIATKGYISNFPKKDVNMIVGFIIDSNEPLVLCSNGCTLWFSDMMANFKRIPMSSHRWNKLNHVALDLSKISIQPGDVIKDIRTPRKYIVIRLPHQKTSRAMATGENTTIPISDSFRCRTILDCIPNPRMSKAEQDQKQSIPAFPDYNGNFYQTDLRGHNFYFLGDERSILNV